MIAADKVSDINLSKKELESNKKQIINFIQKTVRGAGATTAIIGLSGGIDSTLTAYLTVEALGPGSVYGVVMPSKSNSKQNMDDAIQVAKTLKINYNVIEIDSIVDEIQHCVQASSASVKFQKESANKTIGNIGGRVRAVLLYTIANSNSALVVGTGNKTEFLTGYFTKYGDGAVDFHPIANLYKCQVRQLSNYIGVPTKYISKPPTAGLWEGQTDEKEIGMDYDTLDSILFLSVEKNKNPETISAELQIKKELVTLVGNLYINSEHKRNLPPSPQPID
jgi:NAD+ synthase